MLYTGYAEPVIEFGQLYPVREDPQTIHRQFFSPDNMLTDSLKILSLATLNPTKPRDLRFTKIVEFKKALMEKVQATLKKSKEDPNYTTFLKHFGTFTVAKLETKEVSKEDYIIEELREIKKAIQWQPNVFKGKLHQLSQQMVGKNPTERTMMEMRKAIKEAINFDSQKTPDKRLNLTELKDLVLSIMVKNGHVRDFASAEEFEHAFNDIYFE